MEKDTEKIFTGLKEDIFTYAGLKLRFFKLTAIERIARFLAVLSHGVILVALAFFMLLFLFIALGFYIGGLLGSVSLGFLIIGGLYLLLLILAVLIRETIRIKLINLMIEAVMSDNYSDDTQNKPTDPAGQDTQREETTQSPMPGN